MHRWCALCWSACPGAHAVMRPVAVQHHANRVVPRVSVLCVITGCFCESVVPTTIEIGRTKRKPATTHCTPHSTTKRTNELTLCNNNATNNERTNERTNERFEVDEQAFAFHWRRVNQSHTSALTHIHICSLAAQNDFRIRISHFTSHSDTH